MDALNSGNMNAARILQTKQGIIEGAGKNLAKGLITQAQYEGIYQKVTSATIQDFAPRMLKIQGTTLDANKVMGHLRDFNGNRTIEYTLRDTDRILAEIIDQR